jgi:hypothetical protein
MALDLVENTAGKPDLARSRLLVFAQSSNATRVRGRMSLSREAAASLTRSLTTAGRPTRERAGRSRAELHAGIAGRV